MQWRTILERIANCHFTIIRLLALKKCKELSLCCDIAKSVWTLCDSQLRRYAQDVSRSLSSHLLIYNPPWPHMLTFSGYLPLLLLHQASKVTHWFQRSLNLHSLPHRSLGPLDLADRYPKASPCRYLLTASC